MADTAPPREKKGTGKRRRDRRRKATEVHRAAALCLDPPAEPLGGDRPDDSRAAPPRRRRKETSKERRDRRKVAQERRLRELEVECAEGHRLLAKLDADYPPCPYSADAALNWQEWAPVPAPVPAGWAVWSPRRLSGDDVPGWLLEVIQGPDYSDAWRIFSTPSLVQRLCSYCLRGENCAWRRSAEGPAELLDIFCSSCLTCLSRDERLACPDCDGARFLDTCGRPGATCRACHRA